MNKRNFWAICVFGVAFGLLADMMQVGSVLVGASDPEGQEWVGGNIGQAGEDEAGEDGEEWKDEDEDEDKDEDMDEDDGDEGRDKGDDDEGWQTFEFKTRLADPPFQTPYKTDFALLWPMIVLPTGEEEVQKTIPLSGGFKLQKKGKKFYLDTDGDGEVDKLFKESRNGTTVVFSITHVDDSKSQYQLLFQVLEREEAYEQRFDVRELQVSVFAYRRACYTEGEIFGEKVCLVDDNSNGEYDDYGFDSIVIGKAGVATVLSRMVWIGNKLYEFDTDISGTKIQVKEYRGPTGEVSVKYSGAVSPTWLIVGATGDKEGYYYNAAGAKPVTVPVGTYKFFGGRIVTGKGSRERGVTITGEMCPEFTVSRGKVTEFKLGAPFKFDFQYTVEEGSISVEGTSISVFGSAFERYIQFHPEPLRPTIMIQDARGSIVQKDEMDCLKITEKSEDRNRPRFDFETLLRRLPFPENYSWKVKRATAPFKVMLKGKLSTLGPIASDWK